MTQEEKFILLQDLCTRLPYGVMIQIPELFYPQRKIIEKLVTINDLWHFNDNGIYIENVKPYLRPMSSMTPEEFEEYTKLIKPVVFNKIQVNMASPESFDYLNKKMFDYRGLIPKGLALVAPEDMYK